uniref:Uncharacterized protein n=1 Tax=Ditylenchus dipsaci TaxID=166011 RepID=A0A915CTI0_9BILA
MQSAIVSGRLVCCAGIIVDNLNEGDTPADACPNFFCPGVEGALVQIIERDTVDPDDLLANFRSLPNGFFSGIGQEDEMFDVDIDLVVTHQCGAKPGCVRKTTVKVPLQMINSCAAFTIDPFDLFHPGYETTEECS